MTNSRAALSVGALVCAAGLCAAVPAAAYCRTTTCDPEGDGDDACETDEHGCEVGGHLLYWSSSCATYSVQQDGSPRLGISFEEADRIVGGAFDKWSSVDCDGEPPSLQFVATEPVECDQQEYNTDGPNANIWMFRDDAWPYADEGWTLALTTITYNVETGEIYDADVEINSFEHEITVGAEGHPNDLEAIVTHEAGHVVGLSHSRDPEATMHPEYSPELSTLAEDDVRGTCAAYPPDREASRCVRSPRHGFSTQCGGKQDDGCGCAIPARRQRGQLAALLLGALVAAARRRRRRWGR